MMMNKRSHDDPVIYLDFAHGLCCSAFRIGVY